MVEGDKSIVSLLNQTNYKINEILCTETWYNNNAENLEKVTSEMVTIEEIRKITSLSSTPPVVAIIELPKISSPDLNKISSAIYLDDVQDPGNVGTIIRIADWYGVEAVIRSNDSADFYNPKVLQSTMGSFSNVRLSTLDKTDLMANSGSMSLISSHLDGEELQKLSKPSQPMLILGNEGNGISKEVHDIAKLKVLIPGKSTRIADSLNVAISAGILAQHFFS